jgi:hypothetical protein
MRGKISRRLKRKGATEPKWYDARDLEGVPMAGVVPVGGAIAVMPFAGWMLGDMGTPMMWAGPCHLVCGNFVIGVLEGLFLGKVFKVKPLGGMVAAMVFANYVSMAVGLLAFQRGVVEWFLGDVPLRRIGVLLVGAVAVTYLMSVLLEWPFVVLGMWKGRKGVWRTLGASLLANTASYIVLVALYGMITELSLVTVPTFVEKGLAKDPSAVVYFVDLQDNGLYRMRLDATQRERVGARVMGEYQERLQLVKGNDGEKMDVCVVKGDGGKEVLVAGVMEAEGINEGDSGMRFHGHGPALDLRGTGKHDWEVVTRFWAFGGLSADNTSTGEHWRLALETPFLAWASSSATILPGDQVVYEVGEQVVLLDLATKRMQFLARGRNPVAVIDAND